jgi:hypothetical protein
MPTSVTCSSRETIPRCLVGFAILNVVNAVFVQSTMKVAAQAWASSVRLWAFTLCFLCLVDGQCNLLLVVFLGVLYLAPFQYPGVRL